MEDKNLTAVINALGEVLDRRDTDIFLLKHEIKGLKSKIEELEKERAEV